MKFQRQRKNLPPSSHRSFKSGVKSGNSSRSREDRVQRKSEQLRVLEEKLEQLLSKIKVDTSQKNGNASEDRLKKVEELLENWLQAAIDRLEYNGLAVRGRLPTCLQSQ